MCVCVCVCVCICMCVCKYNIQSAVKYPAIKINSIEK